MIAAACALLLASSTVCSAAEPAGSVAHPFSALVEQLSSSNYTERRHALNHIEQYLTQQDADLARTEDPEALSEVATALQFDRRLDQWLLEVMKLPAAQKQAQLPLLTDPRLFPVWPKLFSDDAPTRIDGLHRLAAIGDSAVDPLLAFFIHDDALPVALAAMDILWDRPANAPIITALWELSVEPSLSSALALDEITIPAPIDFHGETLPPSPEIPASMLPPGQAKVRIARKVLAHLGGADLERTVNAALARVLEPLKTAQDPVQISAGKLHDSLSCICNIAQTCHFQSTVPTLFALATVPLNKDREYWAKHPGAAGYYTVRTEPLAALVLLTGQTPADYGLEQNQSTQKWTSGSPPAELLAVAKMTAWWQRHAAQYAPPASTPSVNAR